MTNLVTRMRDNHCHLCQHGADEIERLRADISEAYNLRDAAEGRYCTALGEIERLHAAVKTAQGLAATRLQKIEHLRKRLANIEGFGCRLDSVRAASALLPPPPEILADALQDVVHTDPGPVRAGVSVRSVEPVSSCTCPVESYAPNDSHNADCPLVQQVEPSADHTCEPNEMDGPTCMICGEPMQPVRRSGSIE